MVPVAPGEGAVDRAVSMGWQQWTIVASFVAAPLVLVILWLADVTRPGSFARHSGRDTAGQPAMIWLFAGVVTFFASRVGALLAVGAFGLGQGDLGTLRGSAIVGSGASVVGIASGLAMAWLVASAPKGAQSGLTAKWKDVPIGLGAVVLAAPVLVALQALLVEVTRRVTGTAPDPVAHDVLKLIIGPLDDPWRLLLIAGAVVGAPIAEELTFRAFIQSGLVRACDSAGINRWLGVIAASVLFAGVHAGVAPPHALVALFGVGLCFGIAFERTGRLGVPIVMHAAFNAANIAVAVMR